MSINKSDTKVPQNGQDLTQEQKEEATAKLLVEYEKVVALSEYLAEELESARQEINSLRSSNAEFLLRNTQLNKELQQLKVRFHALQSESGGGGVSGFMRSLVADMELNNGEHMVALFSKESDLGKAA